MKFKLEIACDNAAFHDGPASWEIGRILRELADKVEGYSFTADLGEEGPLHDVNGNNVGSWRIK